MENQMSRGIGFSYKQPWSDFAVLNGGKINSDIWKDLHAATVNPDPSLKEFEGATLRYASLKLRNAPQCDEDDSGSINSDPEAKVRKQTIFDKCDSVKNVCSMYQT
uniref:Amyloid-beta A4 protein-binding B member 2 n=1 Tax=Sphaerodactylus townsendi TaxID=933632 RepID=A0ACB8E718_9SAUR